MPEISKEEARKRLEDSVKNVDWITHFLGDKSHQEDFLEVYRGLHAQLREDDKLEIELSLYNHEGGHGLEIPTAAFEIILYTKHKKRKFVYSRDTSGGIGSGHLLYKELSDD